MKPFQKIFRLTITYFIIANSICAQINQSSVKLLIADNQTNQPITNSSAQVILNQDTFKIITDGTGSYTLTNLKSGKYSLQIACPGYSTCKFIPIILKEGATCYPVVHLDRIKEHRKRKRRS
ncbi:MAG: carboxypeptidase regulatory-like domain-containing protein [Bacteroidetes bacterium]|nr:carboxypeptidase regulatory-like domain-containing protein [Bacteroidota bacterium]